MLLTAFALRAAHADQPIVENYTGRQIATAMVARNLDRGSGFLRPTLDVAPFPNLFLVEPPVYALAAVLARRASGLDLNAAGRVLSAMATALAAWGLHGLVRRREGGLAALIAVGAFAIFPITVRYGRAFQPDVLMLGALLAGLRCWDRREAGGAWPWLAAGWSLLTLALTLKFTAAYVLVPLALVILRPRRAWKLVLAGATLLPALLWYVHASRLLAQGAVAGASVDATSKWIDTLLSPNLLDREIWETIGRFLLVHCFTPVGTALAVWGFTRRRAGSDALWGVWAAALVVALIVLAGKLRHEYYFLGVAPLAAAGLGRGMTDLLERGRFLACAAGAGLLALAAIHARRTFETPLAWSGLGEAAAAVQAHVPKDEMLVAPVALLYAADRRGFRLELTPDSVVRAAGEWGATPDSDAPIALVDLYRIHGARHFADVRSPNMDPGRAALHRAIRKRYGALVQGPGVLLAALPAP